MTATPAPQTLSEAARHTPILDEVDVLVLGGGPAGLAAACAAARSGARTLLVERYGFLGGMGTAAGVTNFCGLHANVHGQIRQVVQGVAADLLARIDALGGLNAPHLLFGGRIAAQAYDTAAFKIAADALLADAGARVLLHAWVAGVVMRDEAHIDAALLETKSGRVALRAHQFIDCTGDADVAAHAGAPFDKGTDGASMMYPSTMMRIGGVDNARAGQAWLHVADLMREAQARGERFARRSPILRPQKHAGEWRANITQLARADGGPVDGTDAHQLSEAESEGRRQSAAFLQFLRRDVPGFEQAYLLDLPAQVGIRETRRIIGEYVLTEEDVLGCASFADSVGVNGWPVEEHRAGDVAWRWQHASAGAQGRGYNQLPWRMLLARCVDNLIVAGRCASMTHGGQSAARVSGACLVMGQAAGTGAALALHQQVPPRSLNVNLLQHRLQCAGAWLGLDSARLPPPI